MDFQNTAQMIRVKYCLRFRLLSFVPVRMLTLNDNDNDNDNDDDNDNDNDIDHNILP